MIEIINGPVKDTLRKEDLLRTALERLTFDMPHLYANNILINRVHFLRVINIVNTY